MIPGLAVFAVAIVLYGALALRLGRWSISMPMTFVAIGFLLGPGGIDLLDISPGAESVRALTELTLALLLFADASTLHLLQVRDDALLPLRLLTIGLLLTIVLGTVVALGLLPVETLALAGLLGAILAPTDAALGLPIFNNAKVPARIRRALNVESGLNDGIATPFVALLLSFAVASEEHAPANWLVMALIEIGIGVLVGTTAGVLGGRLLIGARRRCWTSGGSEQLAILGIALAAYFGASALHGNGFIAAFVGGLVFGASTYPQFTTPTEFTETLGTVLSLLVWVIFGAVLLPVAFRYTADWRPVAYAILSLTVVRMLPVALALIGTRLRPDTVAVMGWFGPRGLASVVFTLLALDQLQSAGQPIEILVSVATWTIGASVLAHGLSAQPISAWYARRLKAAGSRSPELVDVPEVSERHTILGGPLRN
ncbi:MAG: cation:proton antiporter [Ktedonobacterales bacterium]